MNCPNTRFGHFHSSRCANQSPGSGDNQALYFSRKPVND